MISLPSCHRQHFLKSLIMHPLILTLLLDHLCYDNTTFLRSDGVLTQDLHGLPVQRRVAGTRFLGPHVHDGAAVVTENAFIVPYGIHLGENILDAELFSKKRLRNAEGVV